MSKFGFMAQRPDMTIDLDAILDKKGFKLPGFVKGWLKKLLHVDFLNKYFIQGYDGVDFCIHALEYLDVKLEVSGLENVPADGTLYTFVSNHPLGGIDGVALGAIVGEKFGGKVKYLINDILMNVKGLQSIGVPINKTGGQSRNLPQLINDAFNSDNQMVMFPAGLCSRKIDGKIQDVAWGKAFVIKSKQTGRSVVPVHFVAENSPRFYRVANLCGKLGMKFNLAMILLPDEMYRNMHSTFKVIIGKPIPPEAFDSSRNPNEWAQWVREEVYKLN